MTITVKELTAQKVYDLIDQNENKGKVGDNKLENTSWNELMDIFGLTNKKRNSPIQKNTYTGKKGKNWGAIDSIKSYLQKASPAKKQEVADYLNGLGVELNNTKNEKSASAAKQPANNNKTTPSQTTTAQTTTKQTTAKQHTIQKGDTLYSISKKYNCTIKELQTANNLSANNNTIKDGTKLTIPKGNSQVEKANTPKPAQTNQSSYTVKSGDNLYKIAKTYGCTVEQLKQANGLKEDTINPNQKLTIPTTSKTNSATASNSSFSDFENKTENKILQTIFEATKAKEGAETKPYKDSAGKWTIGYGHLIKSNGKSMQENLQKDLEAAVKATGIDISTKVDKNSELTEEQMKVLYYADMKNAVSAVNKRIKSEATTKLNAEKIEVLIDIFYNCGGGVNAPKFIHLIEEGKTAEAQEEIDFFKDKDGGRPLGLVKRNYERMITWNDTLTDNAKQKILDGYNAHCTSSDNTTGRTQVKTFEEAVKAM